MAQHRAGIICYQSLNTQRWGPQDPSGVIDGPDHDFQSCSLSLLDKANSGERVVQRDLVSSSGKRQVSHLKSANY